MAVDMFIKIDDIKGESADDKHKGEIDVLSWSWGATQSGTTHTGGGSGSGKVAVQDVTFTKYIDRSTPTLLKFCFNGKHLKTALLTVRKAGGTALEYIKITLSDIIVTSVSTGGSGGQDMLTENITLNFGKVKFEYVPQTATGTGDASIPVGWDIAANKEL